MLAAPNGGIPANLPRGVPAALGGSAEVETQGIRVIHLPVDSGAEALRGVVLEPSAAPFVNPREATWRWVRSWDAPPSQPLGTLVILHGLWGSLDDRVDHAVAFVNAGYRVVLLDLRGHGESSGAQVGYGKREAEDVLDALTQLRARHILTGRTALIGYSYGGSVALMAAAHGASVDAVVAVAPFAELADVAGNFGDMFGGWLRWFNTPGLVASTLHIAGERGGFDLQRDSPLATAAGMHQPVLLLHGTADTLVPFSESTRLQRALAGPVSLIAVPGRDHIEVVFEAALSVPAILAWLEPHLAPDTYRVLDQALVGWKGNQPLLPLQATWAVRQSPTERLDDWPRPAGGRCVRTWLSVPVAWLGRDLELDLGTIAGRDETWLGAVHLGGMPELLPSALPLARRYRVPAWAVSTPCACTMQIICDQEDAGLHWVCAGSGLVRLAPPGP